MDRKLAGSSAKQISADPDVVAEVEQFVQFESFFPHRIFLDVNLQSLAALLEVGKSSLPHQPDRHEPAGNAYVDPRILQLLGSLVRVLRKNLRNGVTEIVLARIRRLTESFDLFQLLAPQFVNFLVESQIVPFVFAKDG